MKKTINWKIYLPTIFVGCVLLSALEVLEFDILRGALTGMLLFVVYTLGQYDERTR